MTNIINKRDSNRMAKFNRLIRSYNIFNISGYLNILVNSNLYCAGMAEWLLRLSDTQTKRKLKKLLKLKNVRNVKAMMSELF